MTLYDKSVPSEKSKSANCWESLAVHGKLEARYRKPCSLDVPKRFVQPLASVIALNKIWELLSQDTCIPGILSSCVSIRSDRLNILIEIRCLRNSPLLLQRASHALPSGSSSGNLVHMSWNLSKRSNLALTRPIAFTVKCHPCPAPGPFPISHASPMKFPAVRLDTMLTFPSLISLQCSRMISSGMGTVRSQETFRGRD